MSEIASVHAAARRYCIDRASELRLAYSRLPRERCIHLRGPHGWVYSDEAFDIFPRYHTLDAILQEIERFVPEDFASVTEARLLLAAAAETAENSFVRRPSSNVETAAINDERVRFSSFVASIKPQDSAHSAPLPYRRVLGVAEADELRQRLEARWGAWYGGCPQEPPPGPHVTLFIAAMDFEGAYDALRREIVAQGVRRFFELREDGAACELKAEDPSAGGLALFKYHGEEGFWTDCSLDWMVYASHECSITFAGEWLVDRMKSVLPEFARYQYRGWDERLYALR